ncbi:MAG: hypothetical protein FD163_2235 [Hyphomonadaceae bacterium]|nr:MAG: hypothetical protein FD128_979 [Hyphomonadaceae bacterium]KAF0183515.1 MAG: hypothetical protein FD163_2235 [Hyphomonadaceae bacterium]
MLRSLVSLIFTVALCGCGFVDAPNPTTTDWPFGDTNSVQYEVVESLMDQPTSEAVPPRILFRMSRGETANIFYASAEGEKDHIEGRIWFQTRFGDRRIGFAITPNDTGVKIGQANHEEKEAIFGYLWEDAAQIYNNSQDLTLVFSECGPSIMRAEFRKPTLKALPKCDFASANDAWGYVFDRTNKLSVLTLNLTRQ